MEYFDFSNSLSFIYDKRFDKLNFRELIREYPDAHNASSKKVISKFFNIPKGNLLVGAGTTQLIYELAQYIKKDNVLILDPTFWEYQYFFESFDKKVNKFKINGEIDWVSFEEEVKKNEVIILCNPNNPDNRFFEKKKLIYLIKKYPKKEFIVDETYLIFDKNFNRDSLIKETGTKNLSVLLSFSKFFGVGGIRCGVLFSSESKCKDLNKLMGFFITPTLNQEIIKIVLSSKKKIERKRSIILRQKEFMLRGLKKLNGLEITSGKSNFILIKSKKNIDLEKELKKKGLIVRSGKEFNLGKNTIRFSVQSNKKNRKLLLELGKLLT
ncbi:hypothetical protein CMI41_03565 [Candidatus Pacearchaeota archaeon]|nr:hypothetical protein [Candidatus Pacearchaeota archaeon]|tara:strand:- start:7074 stop:8048 length:975 start_codon:yes stop_codon:yes gene_type:complete